MKTVFKSSELAHIWAHRSAPHGRCSSSMSFNGDAFFSYGTVIARLGRHKGKDYVVLDRASFSSTTCKHQSAACRATSHLKQFEVEFGNRGQYLDLKPREIVANIAGQGDKLMEKSAASKFPWQQGELANQALGFYNKAVDAAEFFGIKTSKLIAKQSKADKVVDDNNDAMLERDVWRSDLRDRAVERRRKTWEAWGGESEEGIP